MYIHVVMNTYTHTHTCMHAYMNTCMHTYITHIPPRMLEIPKILPEFKCQHQPLATYRHFQYVYPHKTSFCSVFTESRSLSRILQTHPTHLKPKLQSKEKPTGNPKKSDSQEIREIRSTNFVPLFVPHNCFYLMLFPLFWSMRPILTSLSIHCSVHFLEIATHPNVNSPL